MLGGKKDCFCNHVLIFYHEATASTGVPCGALKRSTFYSFRSRKRPRGVGKVKIEPEQGEQEISGGGNGLEALVNFLCPSVNIITSPTWQIRSCGL